MEAEINTEINTEICMFAVRPPSGHLQQGTLWGLREDKNKREENLSSAKIIKRYI